MILAADIGGTKLLFGCFEVLEDKKLSLSHMKRYPSRQFSSLEEATETFLSDISEEADISHIETACFSMAGPVVQNSCFLVNLGWRVNAEDMKKRFAGIKEIFLCNDLEAVGTGLQILPESDVMELTPYLSVREKDNKAVLAPGTGLGEALILGRHVFPSEGGHCEFGPRTEEEIRLWRFLHEQYGHVSYEHILSGAGLCRLVLFLMKERGMEKPGFNLVPEEVTRRALAGRCDISVRALEMFVSILGAEAGNIALRSMALGGIYLGGGIPPKILPKLKEDNFLRAFRAKGRFSSLVEKIPVNVIINSHAALYGSGLTGAVKAGHTEKLTLEVL